MWLQMLNAALAPFSIGSYEISSAKTIQNTNRYQEQSKERSLKRKPVIFIIKNRRKTSIKVRCA